MYDPSDGTADLGDGVLRERELGWLARFNARVEALSDPTAVRVVPIHDRWLIPSSTLERLTPAWRRREIVRQSTYNLMAGELGFRAARRRLITALREGEYRHEGRTTFEEKNLLAVGEVGPPEVNRLLQRCRGDQHRTSPHHVDRTLAVHEFRPVLGGRTWYVKAYFRGELAWFISVHESRDEDPARRRARRRAMPGL